MASSAVLRCPGWGGSAPPPAGRGQAGDERAHRSTKALGPFSVLWFHQGLLPSSANDPDSHSGLVAAIRTVFLGAGRQRLENGQLAIARRRASGWRRTAI